MTADTPLSDMPGHLLRRLHQHSNAVFQQHVQRAGYDITSVQFSALTMLATQPGLDQAALASLIACDRATIGGVVKRLEQKELIRREVNEEDRRAFRLILTPAGQALLETITPIVASLQDNILADLTQCEKASLVNLMQKALHLDLPC